MKVGSRSLKRCSDAELHALVTRFERAVFAGTSTHRDVVELVAAEQEMLRRETTRVRRTLHEEGRSLSGEGSADWLTVAPSDVRKDA